MVGFNSVVLAGNLTRDPELRYTPSGSAVCDLRMAVSRTWKGKDGQNHEEVCFIDIVLWNRTAEVAAQYLKKGRPVLVHGTLMFEQWVDKKTNEKRSKHKIRGNALKFLGGPAGTREDGAHRGNGRAEPEPEGVEDAEEGGEEPALDEKAAF